jgi:pimeloyl-ACP methyl ester carboxylesterase
VRRWLGNGAWLPDAAAIPIVLVGVFMLAAMTITRKTTYLEDRLFAGVGGDYREVTYGVHGGAGVYPLRIKYFDNPHYDGPPVVLVHGMGTSDAYFWRVRGEVDVFAGFIYSERRDIDAVGHGQGLVDLGYDVVTYTYPDSRNRPIEYQAYDLARVIKWTKERFIKREVILVGHSLGGLICRYYVQCGQPGLANYQFPAKELTSYDWNRYYNISNFEMKRLAYRNDVTDLVLIATPNYGNLKADGRDYGSPALYEMKEESDFVRWLEAGRENAVKKGYRRPRLHVIAGMAYENYMGEGPLDFGDGIVTVSSAAGPFADDPALVGAVHYFDLDHFQLAMDGEVLAAIYNALRRGAGAGSS